MASAILLHDFQQALLRGVTIPLRHHAILRATGRDQIRYLHNRFTQDVKNAPLGEGRHSLVLTPNGRIQAVLFFVREAESTLIVSGPLADEGAKAALIQAILQFKVADQIEISDADDLHRALFVSRDAQPGEGAPLSFGSYAARLVSVSTGSAVTDAQLVDAIRVTAGQPIIGTDISDKSVGSDLDPAEYVSFQKGCYTGQEVIEMSTARGKPNRRLCILRSAAAISGDARELVDTDGSPVGTATSAMHFAPSGPSVFLSALKLAAFERGRVFLDGNALDVLSAEQLSAELFERPIE